jgi:hypothetical protein
MSGEWADAGAISAEDQTAEIQLSDECIKLERIINTKNTHTW